MSQTDISLVEESIVNHSALSVKDLTSTLLVYLAGPSIENAEQAYEQYALCKPALARLYEEDLGAFALVARKVKGRLSIPLHALSDDMERMASPAGTAQGPRESQANQLVEIAQGLTLFHDDLIDPYAEVPVDGHREIWRCRSRPFHRFLAYMFFQQYQKAPSSEALHSALRVIEGKAIFEGQQHPLHNRVAWHDGAIWYDLSDPLWRAARITAQGWEIVTNPPVLFRRYAHQAPQVEPVRGGTLNLLDKYMNLTELALKLFKIALCSYLVPAIPHPGVHPHGQHGAGKSFLLRVIRGIVDPSQVPLLSFPNDNAELAQQLSHHYCAFYDNVSAIPQRISDALCRAVTGEGFTKRELYSDDDDVIYKFRRCIGLNGINVAATAPDLIDRLILAEMNRIEDKDQKEEKNPLGRV